MTKDMEIVASNMVLVHYNSDYPVNLTTDASKDGIGACLFHVRENEERPIAFVSWTFSKAEQGYSMIDKEALGIYFGVVKFQRYLIGRKFKIRTDHEPLVAIFGEKRGILVIAAGRLQRWATFLSSFDFQISHRKVAENVDDCSYLNLIGRGFQRPIKFVDVAKESLNDRKLSQVISFIRNGWPMKNTGHEINGYFMRRNELNLEEGVLMWGHRAVVPTNVT